MKEQVRMVNVFKKFMKDSIVKRSGRRRRRRHGRRDVPVKYKDGSSCGAPRN